MTYVLRVLVYPISLMANLKTAMIFTAALLAVYVVVFIFFNSVHLRRKKEMVAWKILPVYFGMKFCLMFVNTASIYYAMCAYAKYFAVLHPRVTENHVALTAVRKCLLDQNEKDFAMRYMSIAEEDDGMDV